VTARQKKFPLALIVIMLIGVLHGMIYMFLIPPWQHYDEPTHFEYAWLLANWQRIPQPGEFDPEMRRLVAQSMIDHGFYEGLGYLPDVTAPDGQIPIGGYSQLGDPPLYYLLTAVPVGLLKALPVEAQLYGARLMSLVLLLVSIGAIYGMVCELTVPDSPLRWVIPGGVALLPGYAELMSAINNDVGAAAFMSLLLWGLVRLVKRGWSFWTMVWSGAVMVMCLLTKETVYWAAPLWILGVFLSLLPGKWKLFGWVAVGAMVVTFVAITIGLGDAAIWYRTTDQAENTRLPVKDAPVGEAVFQLQVDDPNQINGRVTQLSQLIPADVIQALRGHPVTVGAWMWADEPLTTYLPVLTAFTAEGGANQGMQTVEIGTAPVFYAFYASVPDTTTQLQIHLSSAGLSTAAKGRIYLDGIVVVVGEHPIDIAPVWDDASAESGAWDGERVVNAVRNASGESAGPRVYPWVDRLGSRVIPYNGRPSLLIYSLVDVERSGGYYRAAIINIMKTFWGKFAWGHVVLEGTATYQILTGATVIGFLGCGAVFGYKFPKYQLSALGLLALAMMGIWGLTLVRGVTLLFNVNYFIPGARYAYPVIGPTMGMIGYGWWSILGFLGKRMRVKAGWLIGVLGLAMLILDIWSVLSVWRYYAG
jgi:hypothetical protein